jgi:hypothetical protein
MVEQMTEWQTWPLVEDFEKAPFDGKLYVVEQIWYSAKTHKPKEPIYLILYCDDDGEWSTMDGDIVDNGAATRFNAVPPAPLHDHHTKEPSR